MSRLFHRNYLKHLCALLAATHIPVATTFADTSVKSAKSATRAPASQHIVFDTSTLPEQDQIELFAAITFLRYLQAPIPRATFSVANHLEGFAPKGLVADFRNLAKGSADMPAFELRGDPLNKIVFRDRLTVNAVEVGGQESDIFLKVRGHQITHRDMLSNPNITRVIFEATRSDAKRNAYFPELLLNLGSETAQASWGWGLGLGVGLVAIGLGLWFGLQALSKPKVTVTGIPTNFNVNVPTNYRVDVPSTYTINTNSNINAQAGVNGTQNFNFTAGTTGGLARTIASVTQARVTDAIQQTVIPAATRTGGTR